jgi:hypothetical protein
MEVQNEKSSSVSPFHDLIYVHSGRPDGGLDSFLPQPITPYIASMQLIKGLCT